MFSVSSPGLGGGEVLVVVSPREEDLSDDDHGGGQEEESPAALQESTATEEEEETRFQQHCPQQEGEALSVLFSSSSSSPPSSPPLPPSGSSFDIQRSSPFLEVVACQAANQVEREEEGDALHSDDSYEQHRRQREGPLEGRERHGGEPPCSPAHSPVPWGVVGSLSQKTLQPDADDDGDRDDGQEELKQMTAGLHPPPSGKSQESNQYCTGGLSTESTRRRRRRRNVLDVSTEKGGEDGDSYEEEEAEEEVMGKGFLASTDRYDHLLSQRPTCHLRQGLVGGRPAGQWRRRGDRRRRAERDTFSQAEEQDGEGEAFSDDEVLLVAEEEEGAHGETKDQVAGRRRRARKGVYASPSSLSSGCEEALEGGETERVCAEESGQETLVSHSLSSSRGSPPLSSSGPKGGKEEEENISVRSASDHDGMKTVGSPSSSSSSAEKAPPFSAIVAHSSLRPSPPSVQPPMPSGTSSSSSCLPPSSSPPPPPPSSSFPPRLSGDGSLLPLDPPSSSSVGLSRACHPPPSHSPSTSAQLPGVSEGLCSAVERRGGVSRGLLENRGTPAPCGSPPPPPPPPPLPAVPRSSVCSYAPDHDLCGPKPLDDLDAYSDWSFVCREQPRHAAFSSSPQTRRSFVNAGIPISFIKGGTTASGSWRGGNGTEGARGGGGGGPLSFYPPPATTTGSVFGFSRQQRHSTPSCPSSSGVCTPGNASSSSPVYLSEAAVRAASEADAVAHVLRRQREKESRVSRHHHEGKNLPPRPPSVSQESGSRVSSTTTRRETSGWSVRNLFLRREDVILAPLTDKKEDSSVLGENRMDIPSVPQKEETGSSFSSARSACETQDKRGGTSADQPELTDHRGDVSAGAWGEAASSHDTRKRTVRREQEKLDISSCSLLPLREDEEKQMKNGVRHALSERCEGLPNGAGGNGGEGSERGSCPSREGPGQEGGREVKPGVGGEALFRFSCCGGNNGSSRTDSSCDTARGEGDAAAPQPGSPESRPPLCDVEPAAQFPRLDASSAPQAGWRETSKSEEREEGGRGREDDEERKEEGEEEEEGRTRLSRPSRLSWLWGGGRTAKGGGGEPCSSDSQHKQEEETEDKTFVRGEREREGGGASSPVMRPEENDCSSRLGHTGAHGRRGKTAEGEAGRSCVGSDRPSMRAPSPPDQYQPQETRLNSLGRFFTLRKPSASSSLFSGASPLRAEGGGESAEVSKSQDVEEETKTRGFSLRFNNPLGGGVSGAEGGGCRRDSWSVDCDVSKYQEALRGRGEQSTELERLMELEGEAIQRQREMQDALHREDLEAMLSNVQQVKHFLVVKLRECEAALLATARERDDLEETLRQLGSSLQEKEAEREEALQALQAHSQQQQAELDELRAEVARLRVREKKLEEETTQLKDERTLLRAEVHDRMAASSLATETLHRSIQQLKEEKKVLVREIVSLRRALAESRQELADALARADELESFLPSSSPTPSKKSQPVQRLPSPLLSSPDLRSFASDKAQTAEGPEKDDRNCHRSTAEPACTRRRATPPAVSALEVERGEGEGVAQGGGKILTTKSRDYYGVVDLIRKKVDTAAKGEDEERSNTVLEKLVGGILSAHHAPSCSSASLSPFTATSATFFVSTEKKKKSLPPEEELRSACDLGDEEKRDPETDWAGCLGETSRGVGGEMREDCFPGCCRRRSFSLSALRSRGRRETPQVLGPPLPGNRESPRPLRRAGSPCEDSTIPSLDGRSRIVSSSCPVDFGSSSRCRRRSFCSAGQGSKMRDDGERLRRPHSLSDDRSSGRRKSLSSPRRSRSLCGGSDCERTRGRHQHEGGEKIPALSEEETLRSCSSISVPRPHDSSVCTSRNQKFVEKRKGETCHSSSISRDRVSTATSSPCLKGVCSHGTPRDSDPNVCFPSSYVGGDGFRDGTHRGRKDLGPFSGERAEKNEASSNLENDGCFSFEKDPRVLANPLSRMRRSSVRVGRDLEKEVCRPTDDNDDESEPGAPDAGGGGSSSSSVSKGTAFEVAERVGGVLAAGVSRVWQQLEHALTVEETLIIDRSGVYTPDGVCVEKISPPASHGDGSSAHGKTREPELGPGPSVRPRTTHESTTPFFSHVGKYFSPDTFLVGGEGLSSNPGSWGVRRRDLSGGGAVELPEQQRRMKKEEEEASETLSGVHHGVRHRVDSLGTFGPASSKTFFGSSSRLDQRSTRSPSPGRAEVVEHQEGGTSTGDIVVLLSDSSGEDNAGVGDEPDELVSSQRQGAGLFASHSSRRKNMTSGRRRSASGARGNKARSRALGSSMRDAVCSVWHAAQEALSDTTLLHNSHSQVPHFSASGPSDSLFSFPSSSSTGPSPLLAGTRDDHAARGGAASLSRSDRTVTPTRSDLHAVGRGRGHGEGVYTDGETAGVTVIRFIAPPPQSQDRKMSAWEQLLQRHREAQDMPLFGSTPYPFLSAGLLSKNSRSRHRHPQPHLPPGSKSASVVQEDVQRKRRRRPDLCGGPGGGDAGSGGGAVVEGDNGRKQGGVEVACFRENRGRPEELEVIDQKSTREDAKRRAEDRAGEGGRGEKSTGTGSAARLTRRSANGGGPSVTSSMREKVGDGEEEGGAGERPGTSEGCKRRSAASAEDCEVEGQEGHLRQSRSRRLERPNKGEEEGGGDHGMTEGGMESFHSNLLTEHDQKSEGRTKSETSRDEDTERKREITEPDFPDKSVWHPMKEGQTGSSGGETEGKCNLEKEMKKVDAEEGRRTTSRHRAKGLSALKEESEEESRKERLVADEDVPSSLPGCAATVDGQVRPGCEGSSFPPPSFLLDDSPEQEAAVPAVSGEESIAGDTEEEKAEASSLKEALPTMVSRPEAEESQQVRQGKGDEERNETTQAEEDQRKARDDVAPDRPVVAQSCRKEEVTQMGAREAGPSLSVD